MDKEDIKMYCMIGIVLLAIMECIVLSVAYTEYGACIGNDKICDCIIIGGFIVIIILLIVWCILRAVLIREQGDAYVGIIDFLDTVRVLLFPVGSMNKKEIRDVVEKLGGEKEIFSSVLWKSVTRGVNVLYLLAFVFLFAFGSVCCWVVIEEWLDMSDKRLLMTVMGIIFIVVLYFWALVAFFGIKKRPESILDYAVLHDLRFSVLNNDFLYAVKCGNGMFIGNEYIFMQIAKGMQVVAKKDITECSVLRMAGWNPERLCLPYYMLTVKTEDDYIVKYGIIPNAFYRLKSGIESEIHDLSAAEDNSI